MLTKSGFPKVISAYPGGVGERILNELARPSQKPRNHERIIVISSADRKMFECLVIKNGKNFRFTLKIGVQEGLFIKEVKGWGLSIRVRESIVEVGEKPSEKVKNIANQIIGEYVTSNCCEDGNGTAKKGRNRIAEYKNRGHLRDQTSSIAIPQLSLLFAIANKRDR